MLQSGPHHALPVSRVMWLVSTLCMSDLDFSRAGDVIRVTVRVDGVQKMQLQLLHESKIPVHLHHSALTNDADDTIQMAMLRMCCR
jgi:hypothetical protein